MNRKNPQATTMFRHPLKEHEDIYQIDEETKNRLIKSIKDDLKQIKYKKRELGKRGNPDAKKAADVLYNAVYYELTRLQEGKISGEEFQTNSLDAIDRARPELEKFRNRQMKKILGNLALAIVGLGVFYAAAGFVNKMRTGRFLFFQTSSVFFASSSAKKLNRLKKTINNPKLAGIKRTPRKRS